MSQNSPKLVVALVLAGLALAVSVHTALRGPAAPAASDRTCIDQEARDRIDRLSRALAERDALVARLARAASAPVPPADTVESPPAPAAPPEPGRRRYARFETPNPAVSVTQNADGSYEIRTTDPALAGSVMQITAVTASGAQDKVFIRVPQ